MIYNLYLDESTTYTKDPKTGRNIEKYHSISGIIVEETYHNTTLTSSLNDLKKNLLNNEKVILHEKDIKTMMESKKSKGAQDYKLSDEYNFFKNKKNVEKFYIELEKILSSSEVYIMGASIDEDLLDKRYPSSIQTNKTSIMLQIILENFCHFLKEKNATGNIYYESIGSVQDMDMCMRFHHIKSIGTMYVKPYAFQTLINGMYFPKKNENITGLQIADFIPNNIVRSHAKKKKYRFNLYRVISKRTYDGGQYLRDKKKYGVKLLP